MKQPISRFLFFDRTIGRRLHLIVLIMVLGVVGILAIAAREANQALWTAKGTETRHLVETAHSLVADYQRRAASGEMTETTAQREALADLSRLRYAGDQYFWVNDMAGTMLMHPTSPQLVGTDVLGFRDAAGAEMFRDMIAIVARQNAGLYQILLASRPHGTAQAKLRRRSQWVELGYRQRRLCRRRPGNDPQGRTTELPPQAPRHWVSPSCWPP